MTFMIRPATPADLPATIKLLETAGLPVADLSADRLALIAEQNDIFQGVIGQESFGESALLRSLVVSVEARGSGVGAALVAALEGSAATKGVREMWLLTIDAGAFFTRLGYATRNRTDAPTAIQTTAEFSDLCPGDAVLMSKLMQHQ